MVGKVAPEAISRLKSKATLKIVDYAQLPTAPSSPNEIKNVIIAMIGGLVISVEFHCSERSLIKR